jgi:hypothetical protein
MGSVEERPNGDKILKDFYGKIVGKYDKRLNLTKDFAGRVISFGDTLLSMLPMS